MPKPKSHELDFRGNWSYGEKLEISRLVDGLNKALVGLSGKTVWRPGSFEAHSNAEALRGSIGSEVYQGHFLAAQIFHRVCGHVPANWRVEDGTFLIMSQDEKTLDEYAERIGAEVFSAELGRETGIFTAVIRDLETELVVRPNTVRLAFIGSYCCPRPLFGFPEPVDAEEDPR